MALFREISYGMKRNIRSRGMMFWTLLFPILLSIFYYISFGTLLFRDIESINIGIFKESKLEDIFQGVDILNIEYVDDIEDFSENLDLIVDENLEIYTKGRSIESTIVKSIIDQIKQMEEMNIPYEDFDFSIEYTKTHNEKVDGMLIVFYSLLGMVSSYSAFGTSDSAYGSKGDLSMIGARRDMSSNNRIIFLLGGFIQNIVFNLFSNIVLILFINYGLKLKLFTDIKNSFLLIVFGNLFGAALGMFIGAFNKEFNRIKETIIRSLILLGSTLTGMLGPGIKDIMDANIPIINKMNPIAMVTENLYRVNLLGNTNKVNGALLKLFIYSLVLLGISYILLRRKKYDSI